jgi:hypothetical protein
MYMYALTVVTGWIGFLASVFVEIGTVVGCRSAVTCNRGGIIAVRGSLMHVFI